MTPEQVKEVKRKIDEQLPNLDITTRVAILNLIISNYEYPQLKLELLRLVNNLQYWLEYFTKGSDDQPAIANAIYILKKTIDT